jgi:hypothetical protein
MEGKKKGEMSEPLERRPRGQPPRINNGSTQREVSHCVEVFSADYKHLFSVPLDVVVHTPPEDLHITRLVVCRNYQPGNPESCPAGSRCKFVHMECFLSELDAPENVHVKYCWHHQDDCIYPRLPAGEVLRVSAPNNRMPFDCIPSDCVLATRGALNRHTHSGQLSHCAHYAFNKLCRRGADCHFIHAVVVDPTSVPAGFFSRASTSRNRHVVSLDPPMDLPARFSATTASFVCPSSHHLVLPESVAVAPELVVIHDEGGRGEDDDMASTPLLGGTMVFRAPSAQASKPQRYRHDPYSLSKSTVFLLG